MRRIELLVKQVQRATENERVGTQDGISLEEYYQYFTDGQFLLQRRILNGTGDKQFRKQDTFAASGSEVYDNAPFDIFAGNKVCALWYSESGLEQDYRRVKKRTEIERASYAGRPSQYAMRSGQLVINAYPATGTFRRLYNYKLPRLDRRRTTVDTHTKSATALTALTLITTTPFDVDDYALYDHLTIVGSDGAIKMRGIPYTSVAANGVVTLDSYTFPTGSTLDNGDYVCLGDYHSTHCTLDDQCEDFLLAYCTKRILMRDSSDDVNEVIAHELNPTILDIIELYGDDPDLDEVPVTDFTYFQDLG